MLPLAYNYLRLAIDSSLRLLEALTHSMLLFYGPTLFPFAYSYQAPSTKYITSLFTFVATVLFKTFNNGEALTPILLVAFFSHILCYALMNVRIVVRYRHLQHCFYSFPAAAAIG